MALRIMDTIATAGDFEAVEAKDVSVKIGENVTRLQEAIDNGEIGGGSSTWVGTKAKFNALDKSQLKDEQEVIITDDYDSNGNIYSTEEVVIGKWIDGKPLYRKAFTGLNLSFSATTDAWGKLSTSLDLDYDTLIKVDVYRNNYKVPTIIVSGLKPITYHSLNISWGNCNILVAEYTKTTDV